MSIIKQALTDESGKGSSARLNSFILVISGVVLALVCLIMHAYGIPNMSGIAGVVLTAILGKSGLDTWAAQLKSSKVLVAEKQSSTPTPGAPATPPTPAEVPKPPEQTANKGA